MDDLVLDQLLFYLHLAISLFNLLGWVSPKTRLLHLFSVGLTALSWFGLGMWYGIGYCPLTDWHWQVRERMGVSDMPSSYVKFVVDQLTGLDVEASVVDTFVAVAFTLSAGLSVWLNYRDFQRRSR